ncbi:MAG: response regulator [Candidatus Aminicenantes bacterium]
MKTKKVLIVDDDVDFVRLIGRKIAEAGFEVLTAFDAFQATRQAHKKDPDLIVLDIKLPAGGGLGVLKNLKTSLKTNHIPVIAVTAYNDPEIKKDVLEYNVEEFMTKPFAPEKLVEKLWKYI